MAESNLKEMMIDDINEDTADDNQVNENVKIKWYLLRSNGTFVKVWNFLITCLTIYNLIVTPFIWVFWDVYQSYNDVT